MIFIWLATVSPIHHGKATSNVASHVAASRPATSGPGKIIICPGRGFCYFL
jgi:hypothetical protein